MSTFVRTGALCALAAFAVMALAGAADPACLTDRQNAVIVILGVCLGVVALSADKLTTAVREYWS